MLFEQITEKGAAVVRYCGTRDPFKIARELGILVRYADDFTKLKGMYRVVKRNRFIILNSHMSERMTRIVCAHEVGHDQLHRELATTGALQEFMLYQMDTRPEYEANIFATELLLDTDDVLELIENGYDAEQIARTLHSDINLVALKIAHLRNQGYQLRLTDWRSDFLK
jgi:Zn-dependent peptidase ImmA (M78 family)